MIGTSRFQPSLESFHREAFLFDARARVGACWISHGCFLIPLLIEGLWYHARPPGWCVDRALWDQLAVCIA